MSRQSVWNESLRTVAQERLKKPETPFRSPSGRAVAAAGSTAARADRIDARLSRRPGGCGESAPSPTVVMNDASALLRFSSFELDLEKQELRKRGVLVKLQAQPLKVLALLAERPGELIARDEIRRHVWGAGTFVDFDQGINVCIRQIRQALGDRAGSPRFVETLPRRGYRFLAPVERPEPVAATEPAARPG